MPDKRKFLVLSPLDGRTARILPTLEGHFGACGRVVGMLGDLPLEMVRSPEVFVVLPGLVDRFAVQVVLILCRPRVGDESVSSERLSSLYQAMQFLDAHFSQWPEIYRDVRVQGATVEWEASGGWVVQFYGLDALLKLVEQRRYQCSPGPQMLVSD